MNLNKSFTVECNSMQQQICSQQWQCHVNMRQ